MDNAQRFNDLGQKPVGKLLMQYAIPAIVAMAASSLYNIIDGIFIGQGVGPEAIMGLALTQPFMSLTAAFGAMVGVGASTLMSVKLGQKDYQTAHAHTAFTSEDIMAATMNTELMYRVGAAIGEDCMAFGYSGLYGPGVNMHRTAYSGRNFEYYSEDPFVSGEICTAETQGIQSKGVYVYLKHVALNDSESSRRGVNTWLTEQAAREIYLEVADRAIIDGGAWCTMSGFNRWGTEWCGENYNLQTSYLRGELGMRGMSITDFSGSSQYMDVPDALLAGTDIWDSPMPMIHTTYVSENLTADENMIAEMKEAIHNICYTVVNSNAMNGWDEDTRIVDNIPWWQLAIYAVIAVGAVGTVVCAINLVGALKLKKSSTNRK